eukprot:c8868_g1_i2.p1 GENE.c8868_g1_i2~~c8868_g1_i2.p1  ORF type:complete len:249 (-),score=43.74 c8868_g1_i2:611-1357(-)
MANSRYEYVKQFESDPVVLPNCFMVVRIDGRSFHKFSTEHAFTKPNDLRALNLMNECAKAVLIEFPDIVVAIGQSDEFSFVFKRNSAVYKRRSSKIITAVCSIFTSNYVFHWNTFLPDVQLKYPPTFDGRVVAYPTDKNLKDYISWRQVDCHINNLYNTCFWNLVLQSNLSVAEAHKTLQGTQAAQKNDILFSKFNINYNNEPAIFRKGSVLLRDPSRGSKSDPCLLVIHDDVVSAAFWTQHPELLAD